MKLFKKHFLFSTILFILACSNNFGQIFSAQSAMSDSFILPSSEFQIEEYLSFRWERSSLTNCTANQSVNVDYNTVNGRLQITPITNAPGTNVNGLKSRYSMKFHDGFVQTEVPTAPASSVTEFAVGINCENWYRIYRKNSSLVFQSKTNGTQIDLATVSYNAAAHRYWRIRHDAANGQVLFETGEIVKNVVPTEKEWKIVWTTQVNSAVNFSLSQVLFEIVGGTDSPVANAEMVVFDNFLFNSNSPEVTPPLQTVDTSYPTNQGGITRAVNDCVQLQPTLNAAQPGDTVTISPALTCVDKFTFPVKANPDNKWIIVRSASPDFDPNGALGSGRRINGENPSHAQKMPKLFTSAAQQTSGSNPVLFFPPGANFYRLVGIEIGIVPECANVCTFEVVSLIELEAAPTQIHHVVFDRCYVHGEYTPGFNIRRGIALNGAHLAVVDSFVSKIIDKERVGNPPIGTFAQTQGIVTRSGYGPIKIENNFIETLAQNILLGGDRSFTPDQILSDVVIRRNYFIKRDGLYLAHGCNNDFTSCPAFPPTNGIEIKVGRRIQISENVFEQTKAGVFIKATAEPGCVNCISEHVAIENNKFVNVKRVVDAIGSEGRSTGSINGIVHNPNHITIKNNLSYFTDTSDGLTKGYGGSYGILGRQDVPDFRIIHNTYESGHNFWDTSIPPNLFNFEMRDNIFERRPYGMGGILEGVGQMNQTMFPYVFRKNVLVNNSQGTGQDQDDSYFLARYPCTSLVGFCSEIGTYIASGWDSAGQDDDTVGFAESAIATRRSSGNYRLRAAPQPSAYKNAATDGTDIGVNQDLLDAATYGAVTGIWEATAQTPFPGPIPTIPMTIEAENYDTGGDRVGYHDIDLTNDGGVYRSDGVDIQTRTTASGQYEVFKAHAGEWLEYTVNVPYSRKYDIGVRYASAFNDGQIRIEDCGSDPDNEPCDDITGLLTTAQTHPSNWNVFRTVFKHGVTLSAGIHTFRLVMVNNSPDGCACVVADFDAILFKSAMFDFDADGRSDISVFRPSSSTWYLNRSKDGFTAVQMGTAGDSIAPADFDGDGKTDLVVWRASTGEWIGLRSSNGTAIYDVFGLNGDIPVQADYDGDGKADYGVWRPSSGAWWFKRSSDGLVNSITFGQSGDRPTVGDYDGDGKSDFAIFRPSDGSWWLNRTAAGVVAFTFGNSTDKTVQADYTGDGKTDAAVWRPSTGEWFILRSEDASYYSFPYGQSGDSPAPGDYDGDGKTDVAVFRPSNGTWYLSQSTEGSTQGTFGTNGDVPIASAFVR